MKKCNTCGAVVRGDSVFCSYCGNTELTDVVVHQGDGHAASLLKALLCATAFIAVQFFIAFIFMLVATVKASITLELEGEMLTRFILDEFSRNTPLISIISNVTTLAVFAAYFLLKRRNVFRELGMRRCPPVLIPLCVILGYAMQYVLTFVTALIPWPEKWLESHADSTSTISVGNLILVIIATSVITGLTEEIVFRSLQIDRLGRAYGGVASVIISAVIFGCAHMSPVAIFYATLFGILLGCIYRRFRSVWPCVFMHMAFNLAAILGLPDASLLLYFSVVAVSIGVSLIISYLVLGFIKKTDA